jgi:DNA adenine methylase
MREHIVDRLLLEHRAAMSLSAVPRPFLRWAGSKRAHLHHLLDLLPGSFNTYWEPFLGSGALFFLLRPHRAVLSDACGPLVSTFRAVRDGPEAVLRQLGQPKVDKDSYYRLRAAQPPDRFGRAAQFIYLNKTCWNGLYRVNSEGRFNVPYGRPKTDNIVEPANLRACSAALRREGVHLAVHDFAAALDGVGRGDLVYLDPPYVTRHNNNGFVDYNEKLFSWRDQERLARLANGLVRRGAHVLVSNADHDDVVALFAQFRHVPFSRSSTLASDATKRGQVREALFVAKGR